MSRHEGVSCDACTSSNFTGRRFKCLVCSDYDLCYSCYDLAEHGHPPHPMQCLLNKKDFLIFYSETYKGKAQSYTCPCCGQMGFTLDTLIVHTKSKHPEGHPRILCPVCVSTRYVINPAATEDITSHLQAEHCTGGVRDIVALLEEPGGGVVLNRRNNLQLRFPEALIDSSTTFTSSLAQSVESVRPFTDLLSHISNRCTEFGPTLSPRSVSRSHSRLNQGKQKDKGAPDTINQPQHSSKTDLSGPFVSRDLEPLSDSNLQPDHPSDKSNFVQELILGSLDKNDSYLNDVVPEKNKEPLTAPTIPFCLQGRVPQLPQTYETTPRIPLQLPQQKNKNRSHPRRINPDC